MIFNSINFQFTLLSNLLRELSTEQYCYRSKWIGEFSIGQHVRHIIELFQEVDKGYEQRVVNYDKRKRDLRIEEDSQLALSLLEELSKKLNKPDCTMKLLVDGPDDTICEVDTHYYRELVYNTEHTIHHLSLIRVALRELQFDEVPEAFGFAYSTIRHQQKVCAQ